MKGWQNVLFLIIPYFFVIRIFQFIGYVVSGIDLKDPLLEKSSIQHLVVQFFTLLGTFLVLWIFMKFVDKEPFIKLGFQTKNRLTDCIIGLIIGMLIMTIGYFVLIYLDEIFFVKLEFNLQEVIISILFFAVVAIVEETLLRGYILNNLMHSFNKYVALIVSSILFALMHGFNDNVDLFALTVIFLAGILLGISYVYTKNLWFPIALHFSWNLFQTLYGFNVSGKKVYSIVEFRINESNLLNGGAFGFEGSYLSVIAEIIVIIVIGMYYNKKLVINTEI
jgi:membrane protease YdiL (CAAX protease family)